uniref:Uncharacterized protein n=1 Tax=Arion vulgaris TaxID=1028688 RepID=A0A0B7BF06_9EUPU
MYFIMYPPGREQLIPIIHVMDCGESFMQWVSVSYWANMQLLSKLRSRHLIIGTSGGQKLSVLVTRKETSVNKPTAFQPPSIDGKSMEVNLDRTHNPIYRCVCSSTYRRINQDTYS